MPEFIKIGPQVGRILNKNFFDF